MSSITVKHFPFANFPAGPSTTLASSTERTFLASLAAGGHGSVNLPLPTLGSRYVRLNLTNYSGTNMAALREVWGLGGPTFADYGYLLCAGGTAGADVASSAIATFTQHTGSQYQWSGSTAGHDLEAGLWLPGHDHSRIASGVEGTWYSGVEQTVVVYVDFSSDYTGTLRVYCVDWDGTARRQTVTANDGSGNQTVNLNVDFSAGAWCEFPVSVLAGGRVTVTAALTSGSNCLISGIFLGPPGSPFQSSPIAAARYFGGAPKGNWQWEYGYSASTPDPVSTGEVASNAVDGLYGSWWQPESAAPYLHRLVIDRGAALAGVPFSSMTTLWFDSTYLGYDWTLEISDDLTTWTTVATITGNSSSTVTQSLAIDAIAPGDVVTFDIDGTRAFAMLATNYAHTRLDPGEEANEGWHWEGPGHLAVGKHGLIGVPGGVGRVPVPADMTFDYTHPDYNDGSWTGATTVSTVEVAKVFWGPPAWAFDFPADTLSGVGSGTTEVIWAPATRTGPVFFRETFTTAYDGNHLVFFAVDNYGSLFVDGKLIATNGNETNGAGFTSTAVQWVSLSAGTHEVAMFGYNVSGPGGIAGAIYVPGYPPTLVWESTSSTLLDPSFPTDPPGMTPGEVLRVTLAAEQAAGRLTFVSLGCTDTLDNAGASWDQFAISTSIGVDLFSFWQELGSNYADIEMDPNGWTLNAWKWGTRNPSSGLTLSIGGNLTSLVHKGEAPTATAVLVHWSGGWSEEGSGAYHSMISLGPHTSAAEVASIAAQVASTYGNPREEITATYVPASSSEVPWVHTTLVPGSLVTVPSSDGTTGPQRAIELGATQSSDSEFATIQVTLQDIILEVQQRLLRQAAR